MENRTLLSTLSVTSTNDSGPGSLRQAIASANSSSAHATITFAIPGTGVQTIVLAAELPAIAEGVLIDGFSQPGFAGTPLVELRGNPTIPAGLQITATNVEVRGLAIDGFTTGTAISITGPDAAGNWIHGNVLGVDAAAGFTLPNANGVVIAAGAHDNTIGTNADGKNDAQEANVISGGVGSGVVVESGNPDDSGGFALGDTRNPLVLNDAQILGNRLQLTSDLNQFASAFTLRPVAVTAFTADFQFQLTNAQAEGFTFTIQGTGPNALGAGGAGLGYGAGATSGQPFINQSVAVKFDLNSSAGEGNDSTGLYLDGAAPTSAGSIDLSSTGIDLHSGDVFDAALAYDGARLAVTITDTQTGAKASQSYAVDIPGIVGAKTAYVGFTGATGSESAIQQILSFKYRASGGDPVNNRILGNSIFDDGNISPSSQGALQFDGSSYMSLPNNLLDNLGSSQTFEAWFRTTSGGVILGTQIAALFTGLPSDYGSVPLVYVGTDGKLYGTLSDAGGYRSLSNTPVADGAWHSIALTIGSASFNYPAVAFYLDGTQVGDGAISLGNYEYAFNQIGIGYTARYWPQTNNGWFGFRGSIADVQIWSVARSTQEIQNDLTQPLDPSQPGLEAYYKFSEGSGPTAFDATPNHQDGELASSDGSLPAWVSSTPQAIDLGGDGFTYPSLSPPAGPNYFQNYPVIVSTSNDRIRGWLDGTPGTTYRVEFFASSGDIRQQAQNAQTFLEAITVTTDSSGLGTFDTAYTPVADEPVISATATDPSGNTSEVSLPRRPVSLSVETPQIHNYGDVPVEFSRAAGTAISLSDPELDPLPQVSLTLSATVGSFLLSTTTGLTGTGNGSSSLQYVGFASDLSAALEGMRFDPPTGFSGLVRLGVSVQVAQQPAATAEIDLSFGSYFVTNTADSGPGSLRQAILNANSAPGFDTISFAINASGPQTITLAAPLPPITDAVLIDGFSQPGYSGTPLIDLSGRGAAIADGLRITAADTTIRGLAVTGFSGAGIVITGAAAAGNEIQSNFIGVDPVGAKAPDGTGIDLSAGARGNTIGGTAAAAGNTIAWNLGSAVVVTDDGTTGNPILGNAIHDNNQVTPTPASKLQFDGSNYVSLPNQLVGFWQAETIEAWFQTTSDGVIFGAQSTDPSQSNGGGVPALYVGTDGKLYGAFLFDNPIGSSGQVNDGSWHHAALVIDSTAQSLTLYLDDKLVGSTNSPPSYFSLPFNQIGTGMSGVSGVPFVPNGWFGFQGQIDDVRIWSVARTASELVADSSGPLAGDEPGLMAYYRFDEGSGTTAYDSTANHLDGTLGTMGTGLPLWVPPPAPIDLGGDGPTLDSLQPRLGPNNFQNYPIVVPTGGGGHRGWLSASLPNTAYRIELFASAEAEQAQDFLGSLEVTTDALGQANFNVPFALPPGQPFLTATATDAAGNTSEVSEPPRPITLQVPQVKFHSRDIATIRLSRSSGTAIVVDGPDADPLQLEQLKISASTGSISLSGTTFLNGTGDGTSQLDYFGNAAALSAALDGMRFDPPAGFNGLVTVSLSVQVPGQAELSTTLSLGFGPYLVKTTADSGPGSLRQAILDANDAPGADTIAFAIPGGGVQTIALLSPLPAITDSVLIDGFSEPGYSGSPPVELNGQAVGVGDGLAITAAGVTVRGLAIDGFSSGAAISITGPLASGDLVESNLIGVDLSSTGIGPNAVGITISGGAHDNTIGGANGAGGNTIASSTNSGVEVKDDATVGNRILGNSIFGNQAGTPSPQG
jgi:hypothetical protein